MAAIRLIAIDLDGTLVGRENEFPLYAKLRYLLAELRLGEGTNWAVCTGRRVPSFRRFFLPMQMMGITPDFLIARHAYMYRLRGAFALPYLFWNLRMKS